jgi:hypothetical protein
VCVRARVGVGSVRSEGGRAHGPWGGRRSGAAPPPLQTHLLKRSSASSRDQSCGLVLGRN